MFLNLVRLKQKIINIKFYPSLCHPREGGDQQSNNKFDSSLS